MKTALKLLAGLCVVLVVIGLIIGGSITYKETRTVTQSSARVPTACITALTEGEKFSSSVQRISGTVAKEDETFAKTIEAVERSHTEDVETAALEVRSENDRVKADREEIEPVVATFNENAAACRRAAE